jgi:hypothetical protein
MFHSRPARKVRAVRPRLEVLESRNLLSTYVVDRLTDTGAGSGLVGDLRYCMTQATDGDTITFGDGVTGTIQLTDALPFLTHNISIEGPGPDLLTVSGLGEGGPLYFPIFQVGATVAISGLTIANGADGDGYGGGIANWPGSLTLSDCTVTGNLGGGIGNIVGSLTVNHCTITDNENDDGDGGGILNLQGTATVDNSTIANNVALYPYDGGDLGYGGGVANEDRSSMTIANSTISGNTAFGQDGSFGGSAYGGGIWNGGLDIIHSGSDLVLTNCTVTGNVVAAGYHAYGGGGGIATGISDRPGYRPSTLTINNSTISGNTTEGSAGVGGILNYTSSALSVRNTILAGNYGGDLAGGLSTSSYNLIGGTPLLGPLQDNGGPTQTMALLAGSPALNAGDPTQLGVADQRGVVRSGGVNIGAYQASASALVVTGPATATAGTPFDVTMTAVDPFGQTAVGYTGTVTFSSADPYGATLPADYTFTLADGGVHPFAGGATLYTAGTPDVTATDTVTSSITGSAFVTVNPAAADHLLFLQQPTDTAAGQTISPVSVEVVDAFGNVETGDNSDTITLSLGTNPSGGTLSGTLTVAVVNGVATFGDLSIDLAGTGYTLHASIGGGLPDTDSNPFNVTM